MNVEKEQPIVDSAVREDKKQGVRYLSLDKYMQMRKSKNPTANVPGTPVSNHAKRPQVETKIALEDPFDDRWALALSGETSKGFRLSLPGPPLGDLLELSTPSEKESTLSKAIDRFQEAVKERTMRKAPPVENKPNHNQQVRPKRRVAVTATSTGSPCSTKVTPESSEPVRTPNQQLQALPRIAEAQRPLKVESSGIICFECRTSFNNILALHQHQMANDHNYCHWCFAFFIDRAVLQKHNEQVHNFKCAACPMSYISLGDLLAHQKLNNHCYCRPCNSYFQDTMSHTRHTTALHDKSRLGEVDTVAAAFAKVATPALKYKCTAPKCKFSAGNADNLRDHQRREKHNYCEPCNKTFCDAGALKNHKRGGGRHSENIKKKTEK
ncbi:hypothetical protein PRK78_007267 [Emydomyces testavorans]|uniref:C2H2-type domain-containing protein n=1 Tax=Emydomyces testavorans TaxID=2070801 RepID=A0AAF0DMW5_9EURO|nr:hypothetical protein PRK78_007267 [Emydomyces testavorans]